MTMTFSIQIKWVTFDIWAFCWPIHPMPKSSQSLFFCRCPSTVQSVMDSSQRPVVFLLQNWSKLGTGGPQSLTNNHPSTAVKQRMERTPPSYFNPNFLNFWVDSVFDFWGCFFSSPRSVRDTLRIQAYLGFSGMSIAISELHHQYDSRQEGHSPRHGTLFWSEVLLCFFLPLGFFGDVNLKFTPLKKLTWNTKIGGVVSDSMFLLFSFDMLLISHLIAISNDFGHPHMKKNKI